jgi:hypothetical protein
VEELLVQVPGVGVREVRMSLQIWKDGLTKIARSDVLREAKNFGRDLLPVLE